MTRADIVIVGGGIVGCATAFELARRRAGRIVLFERESLLGTGATAKCAGGIRTQFSSEVNCRVSQLAERIFLDFENEVGVPAAYEKVGYLFCLSREEDAASFRRQLAMWQKLGLDARWLEPAEMAARVPPLLTDDLLGGTFCSTDGLADAGEYMVAYEKQARQLGVEIFSGSAVTGIERDKGHVASVCAGADRVATGLVINCAGPYAAEIGRMAGLEVPVYPLKRQIAKTAPLDWLPEDLPMIVDIASGLYMHRESGGMLMGWADPRTQPDYDISTDADYTDEIIIRALARMPKLETAEIAHTWGGLYESTPDHHAIMGPAAELAGFWNCTGFSGHGFMHAPAAGRLMAEWIVDGKPSIDLSRLALERFRDAGVIAKESNVI